MLDTVISWQKKGELGLTVMEYVVCELIRQWSAKTGWCEQSKRYIADICGISERGLYLILANLLEKKYVEKKTPEGVRASHFRTTSTYNAFQAPTPIEHEKEDEVDGGFPENLSPSQEVYKLASQSNDLPPPDISEKEIARRQSIQPIVSVINLYADKFGKDVLRVEYLSPYQWNDLRKVCNAIGNKEVVPIALDKLNQLGALGQGSAWWLSGMAREIDLVVSLCKEEANMLNYFIKETHRPEDNENNQQ